MKTLIAIASLASMLVTSPVLAQESAPRGWAKSIPQAQCTADKGLAWVEADEFTSAKTGKVRKQAAGCRVNSKAMSLLAYKMNKPQ